MPELPNPKRGLLVDGIMASEAIDSSGEVLDVKGADISSMTVDGVLNYEHKGDQDKAASFNDVIGRCIKCKKVYSAADCENDREKMYWEKVQLPYIYAVFRLFDEAEHENAKAAAAIIRDQHAAGEPLILRFSIEGSTIEKKDNVLKHTIARRCALTIKPANKSAVTGLLYDPKAPPEETTEASDILAGLADDAKKFEHPSYSRLNNSDFTYVPLAEDALEAVRVAQAEVRKTITAGGYNAAPGSLSGGAALQVEDEGLRKQRVVSVCKAAVRDWDPSTHGPFREHLQRLALNEGLGEMSDEFLDMFSDMAYDVHVNKRTAGLQKAEAGRKGKKVEEPEIEDGKPHGIGHPKFKAPQKPPEEYKNPFGIDRLKHNTDTSYYRAVSQATYDRNLARIKENQGGGDESFNFGANVQAVPPSELAGEPVGRPEEIKGGRGFFDPRTGWLHTPTASYKAYAPDEGDEHYMGILTSPEVQRVHDTAIRHWMVLHNLAKQGKLPDIIVASAALNSMMSPNCSIYVQEAADGYLWDMMRRGWDPRKAIAEKDYDTLHSQFLAYMQNNPKAAHPENIHRGNVMPVFMRDHFDSPEGNLHPIDNPEGRKALGFENQRWDWATNYHLLHSHLNDLVKNYGADARSASAALMGVKVEGKKATEKAKRKGETADVQRVEGLAPKTGRYTFGMLGMGNAVVGDTHFIRHIFGMMQPDPRIDDLKATLNRPNNEHMWQGIDEWFMNNHPAFKHTVEKVKRDYGVDLGDQANFLAFWLHWLTIGRHELARGWQSDAQNDFTDHMVYWNHVREKAKEHGIPWTDFRKSEDDIPEEPPLLRAAKFYHDIEHNFGYTPAVIAYYSHVVPWLLSHSDQHKVMTKTERLTLGVLAAAALVKGEGKDDDEPKVKMFRGRAVKPGVLQVNYPDGPKRFPLINVGNRQHHILNEMGVLGHIDANGTDILQQPTTLRSNMRVDAMKHGVPHLSESDYQRDLLEGVDLARKMGHPKKMGATAKNDESQTTGWYESAAGTRGYVKPAGPMDDFLYQLGGQDLPSSHREAIFHTVASKVFGLGEHVPVTATFNHPITQEPHSIQEAVEGGEHWNGNDPEHQAALLTAYHSGRLDKLALMDMVMNSSDRHVGNWLINPRSSSVIHLIDNGLILAPHAHGREYIPEAAHYWNKAGNMASGDHDWYHEPLHYDAIRWVKRLDPQKLDDVLAHLGVPAKLRKEAVRRMTVLKERVARKGTATTKGEAFFSPFMRKTKAQPTTDEFPFNTFSGAGTGHPGDEFGTT